MKIGPITECILFDEDIKMDTHGAYDKATEKYTIVADGVYVVKKYYKAGEVIETPKFVCRVNNEK